MPDMEAKFSSIVRRLNSRRSMNVAYRLIDQISTPVLLSSGLELVYRAKHLWNNDKVRQANYNNQLANQIAGALKYSRGVNVEHLEEKVREGFRIIDE
jgi:hypothetical protein